MSTISIADNYPLINEAANAFLHRLSGQHVETDIAGAASIAGLMLLRGSGVNLNALEPGSVVLVEWVNEQGVELSGFMMQVAANLGLEPRTGWAEPVPPDHQPRLTTLDMTHQLEQPFYEACQQAGAGRELYPYVAALTAVKLVSAGASMKLLDADVGKALALYYTVAGSKTVPYPLA